MEASRYRLDWSRPLAPRLPGERCYHAVNQDHHLLVILTDEQLLAARRIAAIEREEDAEISLQQVVEDAIAHALATRTLKGGELRLEDGDFIP